MVHGRRKKVMTPNLVPLYACAALTIMVLCLFARQNRKRGWKRVRTNNIAEGLLAFYEDVGVATEEQLAPQMEWKPVTADETIGFSAQLLKLRSALGTSSMLTRDSQIQQRELVNR